MQLMPFFVPRLIGPDGALLPGGRYDFFQAGTTTPKAVYDAQGVSLGVSVVVDAGASKLIYFGPGAYKAIAYDQFGVQIGPPADNLSGSNLGPDSGGTFAIVANYPALRNMGQDYDVVVVLGRNSASDGGEGIFYRTAIIDADDDGIVLQRGSTRYKRDLAGQIDPLWYGVAYGSTADQTVQWNASKLAAVTWGMPVAVSGRVYISTNTEIQAGCDLVVNANGSFASNSVGPEVRFLDGSRLIQCNQGAFTENIQPVFLAQGIVPAVRLSWMGGDSADAQIAKLIASSSEPYTAIIDTHGIYASSVVFTPNWVVDPSEGVIDFQPSVPVNLSISSVDTSRIPSLGTDGGCVRWNLFANVGTVHFGTGPVRPEWFGAIGDTVSDCSVAMKAALKHGTILGRIEATYKTSTAQTGDRVQFLSDEPYGSLQRPNFQLLGGLTATTSVRCKGVTLLTASGSLPDVSLDFAFLHLDGNVTLNGAINALDSTITTTGLCTSPVVNSSKAVNTVLSSIEGLPVIAWELVNCTVGGEAPMCIYRASGCTISTPIKIVLPISGGTPRISDCTISHAKYLPTISADSTVYPNVSGCTFTSSAAIPAYAWANVDNWRFPMSSDTVRATYTGSTQNGVKVWDPHAVNIDGVDVEWVGSPTLVPMPYAQWGGLPAGAGASGDNIAFSLDAYTSLPLNDGSTFASTYERGNGSFCNEFGYAMVTFKLTASDPAAFVDVVCATAPLSGLNTEGFPAWPSPRQIVRSVSVKTAVRITPGSTITIPVWIGVENSVVSRASAPVLTRDSTHKLQVQIIGYSVPAGSLVTAKIAETVVTRPEVFEALYAAPNRATDPQTFPIWASNPYSTDKKRSVDSYSFREVTTERGGERRLIVTGNDLVEYTDVTVNDQTTYGTQQWKIENVGGITYYRNFGFQVVAPRPIGPVYYPNLIAANLRGSVLSYTKERDGLTQPTATTQTHIGLEI